MGGSIQATLGQIIHESRKVLSQVFKEIGLGTAGGEEAVAAHDFLKSIDISGLAYSPMITGGLQCVEIGYPEQKLLNLKVPIKTAQEEIKNKGLRCELAVSITGPCADAIKFRGRLSKNLAILTPLFRMQE